MKRSKDLKPVTSERNERISQLPYLLMSYKDIKKTRKNSFELLQQLSQL